MKTLSGRVGTGVIVPLMTYASVPLREVPAAGLVNTTVFEEPAALGMQSTSATSRDATRVLSFRFSRQARLRLQDAH
jgi:hypothetical protein